MKHFKVLNNIFGWIAFTIAAVTYLLAVEPTASFWDCGEFISSAYKLDVGHSPGAPFFMLTGHFFSLFASSPSQVAVLINSMSAILSALTILFLFWTITHIARKVLINSESDYTTGNVIAILGSGMVGALAYTFSDSFWFSAVEGEVYAYSSLFTAIVFWLILKWERVADQEGSDRWLILIAYLMGMSIGVHLLNLLAIPALILVYYFKMYTPSLKGILMAILSSGCILAAILYGLVPGFVEVASWFELFFVNTLGLPYNSGLAVYLCVVLAALSWAIYESYVNKSFIRLSVSFIVAITIIGIPFIGGRVLIGLVLVGLISAFFYFKRDKIKVRWINTVLLMVTVLLIGYSSYAVIVIRSSAKPTMDQNAPDNLFSLKYYLNREQYGDRPLLYGQVYNAPTKIIMEGNTCVYAKKKGAPVYAPKPKSQPNDKDEYIITSYNERYETDDHFNMIFPRMYSDEGKHLEAYKAWGRVEGETVTYDYCGEQKSLLKPTFAENLRFFIDYQVNFMYWRYFLWNFSGRQNDVPADGGIENGNWITGISLIDNLLVGDQTSLPTRMLENKGRNVYFMLPLLLGVFGILFLLYGGRKGINAFWITSVLFFLTGLAIVIYLNQTPNQPRERDYAYVGSFYAFSIWIGLGVLGIIRLLDKYVPRSISAIVVTFCCLGVPALMAQQNWDDHDRSHRYTARDFGQNYLSSCKPNAIIFTMGDNDTFPLWYNQEVEGFRTDVRVCNLSYLQTDWYINQMKRGAYKSAPLPISWKNTDYLTGKNEFAQVDSLMPQLDVKTAFDFILSDDPQTKANGVPYIPTNRLVIPVDAKQVINTGTLSIKRAAEIIPQIDINIKQAISKSDMMMLELIKENKWKRPIYFAVTIGSDFMGLTDHFERTGLAYQLLPVGVVDSGVSVNVNEMYDNLMTKFKYGGIDNPKVYLDENNLNMCYIHRSMFTLLVSELLSKGDSVRANKALDYCSKVIPGTTVPHNYTSLSLAESYYKLSRFKEGNIIVDAIAKDCAENLKWYLSLSANQQKGLRQKIEMNISTMSYALNISQNAQQKIILERYVPLYINLTKRFGY